MLNRDARVQDRAYALWEQQGYPHGADWDHWFEAERQIDGELLNGVGVKKTRAASSKLKKASKGR